MTSFFCESSVSAPTSKGQNTCPGCGHIVPSDQSFRFTITGWVVALLSYAVMLGLFTAIAYYGHELLPKNKFIITGLVLICALFGVGLFFCAKWVLEKALNIKTMKNVAGSTADTQRLDTIGLCLFLVPVGIYVYMLFTIPSEAEKKREAEMKALQEMRERIEIFRKDREMRAKKRQDKIEDKQNVP